MVFMARQHHLVCGRRTLPGKDHDAGKQVYFGMVLWKVEGQGYP